MAQLAPVAHAGRRISLRTLVTRWVSRVTAVPEQGEFHHRGRAAEGRATLRPFASVSDDYFRTLRQGRTFDVQDRATAPPTVVISESMARRYWSAGEALGARIRMGGNPNSSLISVVGIVGDVRNDPARRPASRSHFGQLLGI